MTFMTFRTVSAKTILALAVLTGIASLVLIAPPASAGDLCQCGHNVSGITTEKVGTVSVYRGPAVSYDYAAAERARQNNIRSERARKTRQANARAQAVQNAKIDRLEGKIDALSARTEQKQTRRNIYGYGRSYRGNNRFFGRNGFRGNSNFSGATVSLPNRGRRYGGRRGPGK